MTDLPREFARVQRLADALDSTFRVPGTTLRFGWDGLIGLIPGVGDIAGAGLGLYLLATAWRLGARKRVIARMLFNLAVDAVLGLLPVIGDLVDFWNKAHAKNARLVISEYHNGRLKNLPR